ncbi:MAG: hypothetical protein ABIH99_00110, partial [Candidatus Micrarchaeota archaeon]
MQHGRSTSKTSGSGGKISSARHKRLSDAGGPFTASKVSTTEDENRKLVRGRGGASKVKLKRAAFVNVKTKEGMT